MPTRTPSPTRRRGGPKAKTKRTPRAKSARRSAPRKPSSAKKSPRAKRSFTLPTPPPPEQVVSAVREELQRLGQRWKHLLPRLRQAPRRKASRA